MTPEQIRKAVDDDSVFPIGGVTMDAALAYADWLEQREQVAWCSKHKSASTSDEDRCEGSELWANPDDCRLVEAWVSPVKDNE